MPEELHRKLQIEAREKYPMPLGASKETRERIQRMRDAYVFGTLHKIEGKHK